MGDDSNIENRKYQRLQCVDFRCDLDSQTAVSRAPDQAMYRAPAVSSMAQLLTLRLLIFSSLSEDGPNLVLLIHGKWFWTAKRSLYLQGRVACFGIENVLVDGQGLEIPNLDCHGLTLLLCLTKKRSGIDLATG